MAFRWTGIGGARHNARVSFLLTILALWFAGTSAPALAVSRVDAGGGRLVLHLDPALATPAAALAGRKTGTLTLDLDPGADAAPAASPRRYQVARSVPAVSTRLQLPRVYGDDDRPLVVIDAGHGGPDPGAISPTSGLREKDVTLAIAKAIRDRLVADGRVRVALTRDDDRFIVLQQRFGIARKLHASLFISIHCDSVGDNQGATGGSIYTLSEVASDKWAARLAARENKADIIDGVNLGGEEADVSSILIDLTQRETMNASAGFARLLGREAQPLVPLKANYHRMASLMVLKAADMPSVLFETGYISNDKDAAFLTSREGKDRLAESIERAVDAYFARRMAAAG